MDVLKNVSSPGNKKLEIEGNLKFEILHEKVSPNTNIFEGWLCLDYLQVKQGGHERGSCFRGPQLTCGVDKGVIGCQNGTAHFT